MLRLFTRIVGLLIGASIVAGIAGALAAVNYKKRAPARPDAAADEIDLVGVMEGTEFASTAASLRGGRVICWYAAVDVDLRDAALDPGGASLEVRTVFGGTRIIVAPGVPVTLSGPAVFGGRMNTTAATDAPAPAPDAPGLAITGFTIFGGLRVIAAGRGEDVPAWSRNRNDGHHEPDGNTPPTDLAAGTART
jgi:hypothetical protein